MRSGLLLLLLCSIAALSCRDIQPVEPVPVEISGYLLQGTVTSANGIPLDSVDVYLWYNFEPVAGPIDTTRPELTDPTKIVDVAVLTPQGDLVRQLYLSYRPAGSVPRMQWDYRNDSGKYVPSGEYLVRTAFDTVQVKLEHRIAQGLPTTKTDRRGTFSIGMARLPIGRSFDIYSNLNTYIGTYRVVPTVDLEFRTATLLGHATVELNLNRITTASFTVE